MTAGNKYKFCYPHFGGEFYGVLLHCYSWTAQKNKDWAFGHPKLNLLCAETYWKGLYGDVPIPLL